jgi:hypothetical protein
MKFRIRAQTIENRLHAQAHVEEFRLKTFGGAFERSDCSVVLAKSEV